MNKKERIILIDTKNKTAFDLTMILENINDFGQGTLIDTIREISYDIAFHMLQISGIASEEEGIKDHICEIARDVSLLHKFRFLMPDEKLYQQFETLVESL